MECRGGVQPKHFYYKKCLGAFNALLCVALNLQGAMEIGQEARIIVVFDKDKNQEILFKLCSVGVAGSVLSDLTQFLSNRSQNVVVYR